MQLANQPLFSQVPISKQSWDNYETEILSNVQFGFPFLVELVTVDLVKKDKHKILNVFHLENLGITNKEYHIPFYDIWGFAAEALGHPVISKHLQTW